MMNLTALWMKIQRAFFVASEFLVNQCHLSLQPLNNFEYAVVKFGGTSVGKPERMKKIANLVLSMPGKKIVVLSALSGTTNSLVRIGDSLLAQQQTTANQEIAELEKHYLQFIKELYDSEAHRAIGQEIVSRYFSFIPVAGSRAV
jgi:aspartokinase